MSASNRLQGRRLLYPIIMISTLFIGTMACTLNLPSRINLPNETDISKSVEETLAAEQTLTIQPSEPSSSASPISTATSRPGISETIQAQQATLEAQSTLLSQASPTAEKILESPTGTTATPSSLEPVALTRWDVTNFRQAPGCGEDKNGLPCWYGTGVTLEMISSKPLLIDPAWPKPYLMFSHHYLFIQPATIYIKVDGEWQVLWSFQTGQSALWVPFQVDLSKYKGKEILLQFTVVGRTDRKSNWYIRDPKIIPDFDAL